MKMDEETELMPARLRAGRRIAGLAAAIAPPAIIGGLLYAALFMTVEPELPALEPPIIAARDNFYGIAAPVPGTLWAVGSGGKIVRSEDGGGEWTLQSSQTNHALQGIAAWDAERAVAVGNDGVVLRTADGGARWEAVEVEKAEGLKLLRVRAIPGGEAWAVGEFGLILHSRDYGRSWVSTGEIEDVAWNDVAARGERVVVVGEFGWIRGSDDRGANWMPVEAPVEASLTGILLEADGLAVAVGLDGRILRSTDHGHRWEAIASPTREHLFAVVRTDLGLVAVGDKGVIALGNDDASRWQATRAADNDYGWRTDVIGDGNRLATAGAVLDTMTVPLPRPDRSAR